MSQPRPIYSHHSAYSPDYSFQAQFPHYYQSAVPPLPTASDNAPALPPVPDSSFVTPTVASLVVRRFLSYQLAKEGFTSAEPAALHRLEMEVLTFVEQLYGRAKEYAELCSRPGPAAVDVFSACEEYNIETSNLRRENMRGSRKRKRVSAPSLILPSPNPPSPELLPSDDEGAPLVIPPTLRSLPSHLPTLPPKHTYLRTPAPPPKKQALPSLEKKLENAALVQDSLRNLLLSTEDGSGKEDGELFGGVVNWEAVRQSRRKWKVRG